MAKKKVQSVDAELSAAKQEMMRIRFRRVLGEGVAPHVIRNARRNVAKCVRSLQNSEVKNA